MLTLHYVVPLSSTRRVNGSLRPWTIDKVDFSPLADGAPPPDETLVKACHHSMRDGDGKKVPQDILRTYDLRGGLAAAFREVEAGPGNEPVQAKETAI
ncbi:hypothetical protein [Sphingobium ummariense]|uniref:Uncharacterized protein n=1 Tax=Sphingobium ummariense RL-3 TaxID=1346791 RepID=T0J3S0_9SPHN|nr:hypothetical protein [Sphingobium ummariense]EQB31507.1 hypothetical protein M529_14410 [Sphingobium ummariense RL-3]